MENAPSSDAVCHVAGFLHFVATWSQHPLFPAMVATAGDRGFSLHGLALFAAAHSLAMMRNRIGFQRNPGLLLLSPGAALPGYDEALIEAVQFAVQSLGRKNRGLMGVAPIVLRLQALPDPHTVRFGYGLFPVVNRHYSGAGQIGG